jgi:hypothetical protein
MHNSYVTAERIRLLLLNNWWQSLEAGSDNGFNGVVYLRLGKANPGDCVTQCVNARERDGIIEQLSGTSTWKWKKCRNRDDVSEEADCGETLDRVLGCRMRGDPDIINLTGLPLLGTFQSLVSLMFTTALQDLQSLWHIINLYIMLNVINSEQM